MLVTFMNIAYLWNVHKNPKYVPILVIGHDMGLAAKL